MPSGKYSKKRKTKPVRRRSRRKTHRKMKGGSDDGETIWTAKKEGGGNSWNVSKGIKNGNYIKKNDTLSGLTDKQAAHIALILAADTTDGNDKGSARGNIGAIEDLDAWNNIPGYDLIKASDKKASANDVSMITLTFTAKTDGDEDVNKAFGKNTAGGDPFVIFTLTLT